MSSDPVQETEVKIETKPQDERGTPQGYETREQRDQMKALSLEIFGKTSRYQKLFEYDEVLTHSVEETVPGENGEPDTVKKVQVPTFAKNTTKVKQSRRKYRTVEQVIQVLQEFKAKRDEFIAKMKAEQEAAKVKKDAEDQAKKIQEELAGSALT